MRFYPIDVLKGLCHHLGKARTDRIRYAQRGTGRRQPGAQNLDNTVLEEMQGYRPDKGSNPVDDILTGAARADTGEGKPLSVSRLYVIFQCMTVINTRQIQLMMALEPRQARRYLAAARIALPFLVRAIKKKRSSHAKK